MKERNCVVLYMWYFNRSVRLWLLKSKGDIHVRTSTIPNDDVLCSESVVNVEQIFRKSAVSFGIKPQENFKSRSSQGNETKDDERILHLCHKMFIAPIADLLTEPEIIIVPHRSSCRVPFSALRHGPAGECLSEPHRIRIVPSLMTLRVIQECPAHYHNQTGALVVGDPTVGRVYHKERLRTYVPLPGARKEADVVGQILGVQPLLAEHAEREAVLQAIPSVSLIHLAAHGDAERGEIARGTRLPFDNV